MLTLGINSVYHESSAAIALDGTILAATEEERFSRRKHGKAADTDNAHHLPLLAIGYCLEAAGCSMADVQAIGYSFDPQMRADQFRVDPMSVRGDWGSEAGEREFQASLAQVQDALFQGFGVRAAERFRWVPHHLAHAASTFYPAGFEEASVLVVDGIAEDASTCFMRARLGAPIENIAEIRYPNSIGFLWEKLSKYLGFSEYDACKVMGMAAYGDPDRFKDRFALLAAVHPDRFSVDASLAQFRLPAFDGLASLFGPARHKDSPLEACHHDLAASLQAFTDVAVLALVRELHRIAPSSHLCMAGGVALNCVTNQHVKEHGPFEHVFVPPAPHDAGTAIGAALVLDPPTRPRKSPGQAYLGPGFSREEIERAIASAGLVGQRSTDVAGETARLIADGAVVGWFQGRMEFGPRALGNRSLLGDPRNPGLRDLMNRKVKHRETFRPFAPCVMAEHAHDWFALGRPSQSMNFMLYACPVLPDKRAAIPAVVHEDGTARVQAMDREANPAFHDLLKAFHGIMGVPLLLNTSFNDSEPIVCTPADALATFQGTKIDAVVLGDIIVRRRT
jgi:carbamoyltransferase